MTDREFREGVSYIIRSIDGRKMAEDCWNLWRSGAIDRESESASVAPKACVHIVMKRLADSLEPLSDEGKQMVKSLEYF